VTEDVLEQATSSMAIGVDDDGSVLADVGDGRLRDTYPLRSHPVRSRLAQGLRAAMGRPPTTAEIDAALDVLEGEALVGEDKRERQLAKRMSE
jgi:hypothetical protein